VTTRHYPCNSCRVTSHAVEEIGRAHALSFGAATIQSQKCRRAAVAVVVVVAVVADVEYTEIVV